VAAYDRRTAAQGRVARIEAPGTSHAVGSIPTSAVCSNRKTPSSDEALVAIIRGRLEGSGRYGRAAGRAPGLPARSTKRGAGCARDRGFAMRGRFTPDLRGENGASVAYWHHTSLHGQASARRNRTRAGAGLSALSIDWQRVLPAAGCRVGCGGGVLKQLEASRRRRAGGRATSCPRV